MQQLKAKLKKQGGFTLIEMLIVVAIIAILIAISIPLVNNALDRTRHATDSANERAAKAEILLQYLAGKDAVVDGVTVAGGAGITPGNVYYYDAQSGGLSASVIATPYGQCTNSTNGHVNCFLALKIDKNGNVDMVWATAAVDASAINNVGLCGRAADVKHTT